MGVKWKFNGTILIYPNKLG